MGGLKIHAGIDAPGLLLAGDARCLREHAARVPGGGMIVELGSLFGCSALIMAEAALPNVIITCVDTWERVTDIEPDTLVGCDPYEVFCSYTCASDSIRALRSDSVKAAANFEPRSVDLVFVDGGHSFEQVTADLRVWWPKLKHGGVLLGHDGVRWSDVERAAIEFAHEAGHVPITWEKDTYGMYKMVRM